MSCDTKNWLFTFCLIFIFITVFIPLEVQAYDNTSSEWKIQGDALIQQGRYQEALDAYNKSLNYDSRNIDAWAQKGYTLRNLGRYQESLEAYNTALRIEPNSVAYLGKGMALYKLGRYEDGLDACNKALSLDPDFEGAWIGKAIVLDGLGRNEEALDAVREAIAINSNNANAWYVAGEEKRKLGRYQEALESFDKVLRLDPNYTEAWIDKGVVLEDLGRYDDALNAYNKALTIDPGYTLAQTNKNLLLAKINPIITSIPVEPVQGSSSLSPEPMNIVPWIVLVLIMIFMAVGSFLYLKKKDEPAESAPTVISTNKTNSGRDLDGEILELKNQLLNPVWETFEQAANQIGSYARSAPDKIIPLIPMLIVDLYSREDRVASGAALALTKIVERNSEILVPSTNDLIQFLEYTKNHQYEIIGKRATIFILGIVGVKNPALVNPVITEYLNDTDEYVQKNAKQAIANLNVPAQGGTQSIPVNKTSSPRTYSGRSWDLLQLYCKRVNEHWNSNNPGFVVLSKDEEKEFIDIIKNLQKNEESIQLLIKLHSPPCMKYIDDVQMAAMAKVNEFDIRHLL